jgi:YD repeat-containing protein
MNRIFFRQLLLVAFSQLFCAMLKAQVSNNDQSVGAINVSLPKTPESQAFEKYGTLPVSELTGTANISIPIYTLKSRFLEVPITLNYSTTGIKVSQEASWVGLGFDLSVGGRITVETKGCIDNDGLSKYYFTPSLLAYGMQKLFTRLGNPNGFGLLTFASTCAGCDTAATHDLPDDYESINAMAQYGLGQPDIFRASFMGHSFAFYFNAITDSLEFIGEKSLFRINAVKDSDNRILNWTLTDNSGATYFFNTRETTYMTMPALGPLVNNSSTSAWLLDKIVHPGKDTIFLTYANYGNSYPVNPKSASMTYYDDDASSLSYSDDNFQNEVIQQPRYLTKIESADVAVEFVLGNRQDLKGAGSKRLEEIRIRDKVTNTIRKRTTFAYNYFVGTLTSCYTSQPDSITDYYKKRLRLDSLTVSDSANLQPPYRFFYFSNASIPHKLSMAIDHWGYFNNVGIGTYSDPCSPRNLIPNPLDGIGTYVNRSELDGFALSRDADSTASQTMMLDSIVYPTGGSNKLLYEPHVAAINAITGAGLRIKSIRTYNGRQLINSTDYTYTNGTYLGNIRYHNSSWAMSVCGPASARGDAGKEVLTSNGVLNDADMDIAYGQVKITTRDRLGKANGYAVKLFHVPNPRMSQGSWGYNVQAAHWPSGNVCDPITGACTIYQNTTTLLFPDYVPFAPTPTRQLDGKLTNEKYYDNDNHLLKEIDYYYHQADYSEKFYSVQVIDNRVGGSDVSADGCGGYGIQFAEDGSRRYTIFASPAKSFFTLTDSVIEKDYEGTNVLAIKKAYRYNQYFQPAVETVYNSDGTQTITKTTYPLDLEFPYPLVATGDVVTLTYLKGEHIYDEPIEQTVMKKTTTGDSLVLSNRVNIYDRTFLKKVFDLNAARPLIYRTQFSPLSFHTSGGNFSLQLDDDMELSSTGIYSLNSRLMGIQSRRGNAAYVWDDSYDELLAQVMNADTADVAFASFETPAKGRWSYSAGGITNDANAFTGAKTYDLSSGNVSVSGLNTSKSYIVSYWTRTGSKTVNGASSTQGLTINQWVYYEHVIDHPSGGNITISGSGTVDELRLFPKGALMNSYTYSPIIGITSQSDASNRVSYYDYDGIGRLSSIRDAQRNIVKQFAYGYNNIFQYPYGNTEVISTATKSCPANYVGSVPYSYKVPANTYGSYLSTQDATRKAKADVDANGQAWADSLGFCRAYYSFSTCCGFSSVFSNFNQENGTAYFQFVLTYGSTFPTGTFMSVGSISGVLYLPAADQTVTVNEGGRVWQVQIKTTGGIYVKLVSGTAPSSINLSGSYTL